MCVCLCTFACLPLFPPFPLAGFEAGKDILDGGDGADTLNGGSGPDVLDGGSDPDVLYVCDSDSTDEDLDDTVYIDC